MKLETLISVAVVTGISVLMLLVMFEISQTGTLLKQILQ